MIDAGDADSGMFLRPLVIDHDGNIIEGEARWARAIAQCQPTILCLVYDLNKEHSLKLLLELATPHDRLNKYCRVTLADTLALAYTRRAQKTESIAPEAESAPSNSVMKEVGREVLGELARLAGVSIGTYRNARFVRDHGIPRLHEYVRADKISIHRAYSIGQEDVPTQNRLIDEILSGDKSRKKMIARLVNSSRPDEVSLDVILKGFRTQIEKLRTTEPIRLLCDKVSQILNEIERELKTKGHVDPTNADAWSRPTRSAVGEEGADLARAPGAQPQFPSSNIDQVLEIDP